MWYFDINDQLESRTYPSRPRAGTTRWVEKVSECGSDANELTTSGIGRYAWRGRAGSPNTERS